MAESKKNDNYAIDMDKLDPDSDRFKAQAPAAVQPRSSPSAISNSAVLPVLSYCASSILMTVTNKYVLSGVDFNLNFFLLCVQVCTILRQLLPV